MLISGDLVKVQQGSVITLVENEEYLSVILEPEYAVVVDSKSKSKHDDKMVTVLINEKVALVNRRNLSLVGG